MKKILFIIFLFCSLSASSQCRIGFTHKDITKELTTRKLDFKDNGTIIVNHNHYLTSYIFADEICITTIISPLNKTAYDSLIGRYNTYYKRESVRKWNIPNTDVVVEQTNNVFTLKLVNKK